MRSLALLALTTGCGVTGLQPTRPVASDLLARAQPFALPASDGKVVSLAASLPAVLVFYRGHW